MEYKELESLLDKYFEGETTLVEEQQIVKFFEKNTELPEKYNQIKAMFEFFKAEKESKADFDIESTTNKKTTKIRTLYYQLIAVAAIILIVISIFTNTDNSEEKKVYAYINGKPIMNEQVAEMEAKRALLLISSNFNQGTENLKHLSSFSKAEMLVEGTN